MTLNQRLLFFTTLLFFLTGPEFSLALSRPVKILITTFDPFDGNKTNSTQALAKELLALNSSQTGIKFEVCNLPVEFEVAAKVAEDCYNRSPLKPDIAVSLGEGACDLELAEEFHNLRDAGPMEADNKGAAPRGQVIDPDGPDSQTTTL